jgi:hypothetical protein
MGGYMQVSRRQFLTVSAALLAACAYRRSPSSTQAETTLLVDNQSVLDMNIYVLRGAERIRIGTAGGVKTTLLRIPPQLIFGATPLRFLADPIGSNRTPISDEIIVSAGDQVTLRIPPS